jgi:hypothetical protein
MPFSYPDTIVGTNTSTVKDTGSKDNKPKINKSKDVNTDGEKSDKKLKVFRYTSLGVGVVGSITGIICGVKIGQYIDQMALAGKPPVYGDWDTPNNKRKKAIIGCSVGGGLGVLGLAGFGFSYAF